MFAQGFLASMSVLVLANSVSVPVFAQPLEPGEVVNCGSREDGYSQLANSMPGIKFLTANVSNGFVEVNGIRSERGRPAGLNLRGFIRSVNSDGAQSFTIVVDGSTDLGSSQYVSGIQIKYESNGGSWSADLVTKDRYPIMGTGARCTVAVDRLVELAARHQ